MTSAPWRAGSSRQPEGNRNAGLYWAANRALEADPGADLSPLADAARQAGLGDQEVNRTLDSARRTGQARPEPPDHQAEAVNSDEHQPPGRSPPGPSRPAVPGHRPGPRDVRRLRQDGRTYRGIAAAAGLAPATVSDLDRGRRRPNRGTTAAVLAVTSKSVPRGRVDAGDTRLRLRALHVMGHGSARIGRALGVRRDDHPADRPRRRPHRQPGLRDKVADLYDAWWDKRAPARTPFDRGAATAARKRAIAGDWCAGAALDDDLLDVPGYRPRYGWKPATGTGVAPDVRPRARRQRRDRR